MKTDPRVLAASMEKLSTLPEEVNENIETKQQTREELNNNINNNNRKMQLKLNTQISAVSTSSIESRDSIFTDSDSIPGTPTTPRTPSAGDWIGMGTYRRRKISKERTRSLKEENEDLGLENIIPRHKSPKALGEMGKQLS